MRLRLRTGPHPAVTEHHARLLQDAHPRQSKSSAEHLDRRHTTNRRTRQHQRSQTYTLRSRETKPFRQSHCICILTSYACRQNNCCSIAVLRWRPTTLITACATPQVSLPNMASLFLSRKTRRQDIISSIFHNLQLYSKVSVAGCFHAWIASADTPLQKTRHVLRKAHIAVRGRRTRPPFLAQPTSYNQPPRAPA